MALYLVTGGAGFIGSHTVRFLLERGQRVRVLDDFSSGRAANLRGFEKRAQIVRGDIRNPRIVARAVKGADCVIHLAAVASVERSLKEPLLFYDVNVNGTFQVLEAARKAGVRRVVLASSSSVYGDKAALPKKESAPPAPLSPYAASKAVVEVLGRLYWEGYGLETLSLRYFNVFGPGQNPRSRYAAVVPVFIESLLTGRRPPVYGDGKQSRDFTYVANVARANWLAARAPKRACGGAYNIGGGGRATVLELGRALARALGKKFEPRRLPARRGEVRASQADVTLARRMLGYEPLISFEEGLQKTAELWRR